MPMMIKKLNAADPTIVPGPRLSASNFSPMISITDSRISKTKNVNIYSMSKIASFFQKIFNVDSTYSLISNQC
jgi:hypothetical protein